MLHPFQVLDRTDYRFASKNSLRPAIAASSSAPSAVTVTVSPCFTPRDISIISCVSFFVLPSFVIVHSDSYFFASFTRSPAGLRGFPVHLLLCTRMFSCCFSPLLYIFLLINIFIRSHCPACVPDALPGSRSRYPASAVPDASPSHDRSSRLHQMPPGTLRTYIRSDSS